MQHVIGWCLAVMMLALPNASHALLADSIFVLQNGHVVMKYLGYEAAYTNTLSLHSPFRSGAIFINKTTPIDSIFDLGVFPTGTPLVFDIYVHNTGHTFFTGPAGSNPDLVPHAYIDFFPNGNANIGFEDLWSGGDSDYNDLRFSLTNVSSIQRADLPEPSTWGLLLAGMAILGWSSRRRTRRHERIWNRRP